MKGFFFHHHEAAHEGADPSRVYILFEDPAIKNVFAQLLTARGCHAEAVDDIAEIQPDAKVISEANFFIHFSRETQNRCLVVGDNTGIEQLAPVCLTRPLTEEKVEQALEEFFRL